MKYVIYDGLWNSFKGEHSMRITELPFVKHVGITVDEDSLCLELSNSVSNHVGSLHAGALYTLAEAASGRLIIEALVDEFPNAQAVVRNGNIKYRKAAMQRCSAKANVDARDIEHTLKMLKQRGRARLEVNVELMSDTDVVADAMFMWWLTQ